MTKASIEINIASSEPRELARLVLVSVKNRPTGMPLPDAQLAVTVSGDGRFDGISSETQRVFITDSQGITGIPWQEYPVRENPPDISSTITVDCADPNAEIRFGTLGPIPR